ncbi:hypothetical protein [Egbenema bharatensis]|uniref:hypothetical protein n=1 Tax=Egbenema bharatensis TaxID=3463334 RepID=UPI003A89A5D8
MSEANAPSNRQQPNSEENNLPAQPESHANPFIHAMNEFERQEDLAAAAAEPVGRPGDEGSVPPDDVLLDDVFLDDMLRNHALDSVSGASGASSDRLPVPESTNPVAAVPSSPVSSSDSVTLNPGAEDWVATSDSTNLSDLISLIQELNQCNTILLDRVSQLEEALERSQNALKNEVQRSQDHPAFTQFSPDGVVAVQELSAAQEQIMDLYKQLEFVHQTSQRQQILVETLTGELEASQERVAHLEREAALVQRRYNEQSQVLTQYENSCRDLQARLHRQQRYTLQFKAALEKSLEVSSPPFESVSAAVAAVNASENFFLPKAQRIQPWAVPEEESSAHLPWMKLSASDLDQGSHEGSDEVSAGDEVNQVEEFKAFLETLPQSSPQPSPEATAPPPAKPRPSVVKLPGFGNPIPRSTAHPAAIDGAAVRPANQSPAGQSPAGQSLASQPASTEIPDEQLRQKLDAAVQPLADMLAQAMLSDRPSEAEVFTQSQSLMSELGLPDSGTTESRGDQVDAIAKGLNSESLDEFPAEPSPVSHSSDEELLNSVMAEAEDALWQDLARLIDVSTEDIVKASLSGDVSAFESINFEAAQAETAPIESTNSEADSGKPSPDHLPTPLSPSPQVSRSVSAFTPKTAPGRSGHTAQPRQPVEPDIAASHAAASQSAPQPQSAPTPPIGSNPSWPSPVVYPLRPAKKRRSLAAVDLPSFLQQEPGPLPT